MRSKKLALNSGQPRREALNLYPGQGSRHCLVVYILYWTCGRPPNFERHVPSRENDVCHEKKYVPFLSEIEI